MTSQISMTKPLSRVLLIEDDAAAARIFKAMLKSEQTFEIDVTLADRVEAGIKALSESLFDCILLDLNLPDSQGLETISKIQTKTNKIPIVVLTGNDDDQMAVEAVRRGAQDYVVKGRVDGKILTRIIRYAMERKRFDEVLRDSEARHRQIAANIPGAIYQFMMRPDGAVSFPYMSDGIFKILGVRASEIVEDSAKAFGMIVPEDLDGVNLSIAESAKNMTMWKQEFRVKTMHGIKWLRATSSPQFMADQNIVWDGVILDITDLKNTQEELQDANLEIRHVLDNLKKTHQELKMTQSQLMQAEKMDSVGRLAAGVAHEVKNPLAIMLQGIEYLSTVLPSNNLAALSTLRDIEEAVSRADNVIRGLLDFSSLSDSVNRPENIHDIIEEALLLSKHEFERLRIEVVKNFQQDLPKANVDQNRMQQVFVNLFLNSISAMGKDGKLRITTNAFKVKELPLHLNSNQISEAFDSNDQVILIEITDSGSGIPADILDKIFEPFFTTRRGKGGTGLGLPIVKSIIEMHHGRIQLTNEKGSGAKASILLKACQEGRR